MTLDGFLSALTLIIAIIALVPAVQWLRATLSWPLQGLLAATATVTILWLELYEPALTCAPRLGALCEWIELSGDRGTVARKDAFLVALAWGATALLIHRFSRIHVSSVPALARLTARLVDENRTGEALMLLAPHIDLFARAARRKGRWQRLHDRFATFGRRDPLTLPPPDQARWDEELPEQLQAVVRPASVLIPAQTKAERAAVDTFRLLYHSPQILSYVAEQRPDLALPLLRTDIYGFGDFSDAFLERLIAQPGSALYRELEQNQNLTHPIGYALPSGNRLLCLLFADAEVAVKLGAWQPIGNYLERLLDGAEQPGYIDRLNGTATWYENEWWRDPAFVGIFYFDVMISSALQQGVKNHMWLFYFTHFADRIARVYDSAGPGVDRNDEFPTRGARLLYELVSYMTKWIRVLPELPDNSPHKAIPANPDQTGMNIPFSAASALGRTFAAICRAGRVDEEVIETLHSVIARTIRELPRHGPYAGLRQHLIAQMVQGGGGRRPRDYLNRLAVLLMNTDHVIRADVDDYQAAIDAAA